MARKITGQEEGKKQTKRSNKPKVSKKKLSSSVSSGHVAIRNINQKIRQKIQLSEEDILQAKINEANKRIQKERERQIAAEVISEESGEPINLKRGEWGKKALTFAEKELARLYGKGADAFTMEGIETEEQKESLNAALDRVLASKMLTEKGRREQAKIATANFFGKDPSEVTRKEMNLLARLDQTGLLDKMKELNMQYSILFDALELGSNFANRSDIELKDKIAFLDAFVNNKNGFQEQFTVNGVIDFYGALGEYFGTEEDTRTKN